MNTTSRPILRANGPHGCAGLGLALLCGLAGPLAAQPPRPAAAIAAEQDSVQKKIAAKGTAPAPASTGRPIPGEMGRPAVGPIADEDAPISLLGVVSGRVAISRETVRLRAEATKVKEGLQPKIDEQNKIKEQCDQQISALSDQISALEKQRGAQVDKEKDSDRRDAIRRNFENQINGVREKQDELTKKKNEADAKIDEILQDPALIAANRKFLNETVKDGRRFFPQNP